MVPVEINTWINMNLSEMATELEISNTIKHPCSCDLGDINWAEVISIKLHLTIQFIMSIWVENFICYVFYVSFQVQIEL